RNLPNAHRFIVALRNLRDAGGTPIAPSRLFKLYRDAIPTYLPAVEARRAHMEDLFATLAAAGIPRGDLALAWDFTTQSVQSVAGKMLHMRDDAFSILAGGAPSFQVNTVTQPLNTRTFRQIDGTFQVPLYMTNGGVTGSRLRLRPHRLPGDLGHLFPPNLPRLIPPSPPPHDRPPLP